MQKIALGTVQFGLDYGIHNQRGKVSAQEVGSILTLAQQNGIDTLDTAAAYGDSEKVLGTQHLTTFKIVSKLFPQEKNIRAAFNSSLNRLKISDLYAYLIHRFSDLIENPEIWEKFLKLKEEKKVAKIGVSLYHPQELKYLWNHGINPDLVQIPYNIFDRRFENIFPELKRKSVEIHTRSAFLQGLFFKKASELPSFFKDVVPLINQLHQIGETHHMTIAQICLGFCLKQVEIDRVVIGVDSLSQLQQNLQVTETLSKIKPLLSQLNKLSVENEQIINPANWKL